MYGCTFHATPSTMRILHDSCYEIYAHSGHAFSRAKLRYPYVLVLFDMKAMNPPRKSREYVFAITLFRSLLKQSSSVTERSPSQQIINRIVYCHNRPAPYNFTLAQSAVCLPLSTNSPTLRYGIQKTYVSTRQYLWG